MRAEFRKFIHFGEEFIPELEDFLKFISSDKRFKDISKRGKKKRFSGVIKFFIKKYNEKRRQELLKNATPNVVIQKEDTSSN